MTIRTPRIGRTVAWAALLAPLAGLLGCHSAVSGHAPGLAGGQTLSPGEFSYPLAYVKRPVPKTDVDARDLVEMTPGGDLYVRDQASAGAPETNVTATITKGQGDVRDLDVSPDGTRLVFALHLPLIKNAMPNQQTTWNIYEYDATTKTVTQLTNNDITIGDDLGPHFLPDGRIVFASTRQTATEAIELDENRPQYPAQTEQGFSPQQGVFQLHVMNADGSNVHQITFNAGHDFDPSVLNDGQVVFSRWERVAGTDEINLYRTNPDGTGLELYYGANSHATGANAAGTNTNVIQFLAARQRPDGRTLSIARPFLGTQQGGDALLLDAEEFVEYDQTTLAASGAVGPAEQSATDLGVTTDANLPSLGGRIASVYPLYDGTNRMIISWSPCLLLDSTVTPPATQVCTASSASSPTAQMAPPQYTLWVYDPSNGTLTPLLSAAAGIEIVDPVIMQPRSPAPTFIPDAVPTGNAANLANANVGILEIRSVYDVDG
ncbi:MAG: PD40 domain-containing protein, partial [Gammaproteobacteria bacterium]|nr:PD40 domain-containing protein [Gammaproteobacteria bacterium]